MLTILLFIGVLQCLAVLRAFCQWKIEHQLSTVFFHFFCNHFHKDGLHLSHAQMHSIVALLLY